jgi:hypothetical protein
MILRIMLFLSSEFSINIENNVILELNLVNNKVIIINKNEKCLNESLKVSRV